MNTKIPTVLYSLYQAVKSETTPGANAAHIAALFSRADQLGLTFRTQNAVIMAAQAGEPIQTVRVIFRDSVHNPRFFA